MKNLTNFAAKATHSVEQTIRSLLVDEERAIKRGSYVNQLLRVQIDEGIATYQVLAIDKEFAQLTIIPELSTKGFEPLGATPIVTRTTVDTIIWKYNRQKQLQKNK